MLMILRHLLNAHVFWNRDVFSRGKKYDERTSNESENEKEEHENRRRRRV
jgi:hypothetical protein